MTTNFGKVGALATYHEHRLRLLLHRALESLLSLLTKRSCEDMEEYTALALETLNLVSNLVSNDVYTETSTVEEMLVAQGYSNEVRTASTYKKSNLLTSNAGVLSMLTVSWS